MGREYKIGRKLIEMCCCGTAFLMFYGKNKVFVDDK